MYTYFGNEFNEVCTQFQKNQLYIYLACENRPLSYVLWFLCKLILRQKFNYDESNLT